MPFVSEYSDEEPTRDEVDHARGLMVLEFGAGWCGHCQALSPKVEALLDDHPEVQHLRIADGRGRRLGRSFRVKLWPTFILLHDGKVMSQLVRPTPQEVRQAMEDLVAS